MDSLFNLIILCELFIGGVEPLPIARSFSQEVIPILTRSGCNSGTCHGTPTGKNGFRLSLRGFDLNSDAVSLVRELQGRRINRLAPEQSLILLKATSAVPHEGGKRFDRNSPAYEILRDWIAQGAPDNSLNSPALLRLDVSPPRAIVDADPARSATGPNSVTLRVSGSFSDGTQRDVTHLTRFSVNDAQVGEVHPDGVVHKVGAGEVAVTAEYMGQLATSRVVFRDHAPNFVWREVPEHNFIDRHIFAKLRELRILPAELSTDSVFLRRVFLDAIGVLPTPAEARQFLADGNPSKRKRLIDDLLERPEFADWWAMKWADRLGCNQRFVGKIGAIKYHAWIRDMMARNVPEDEFARTILTASGGNYGIPPAGFYRRLRDPLVRAEEVSQLFLGVRLQCARCHNHPGENWTQDDYYGMAAFFARVAYKDGPFFIQVYDKEETVYPARTGEVMHPRSQQATVPKLLGAASPPISEESDRRLILAAWLTQLDNPFFAKASVNRYWFHLFGRGIVDPVDDFRSSNLPSNEELLEALAQDFIASGFDRKRLIRTILNSRTYQLSAGINDSNKNDVRYFAHASVRLLPAEALLDALSAATNSPEEFPGTPRGERAVALPDGEYKHPFLESFGRPARAMACECERDPDTNLSQALRLVGGKEVHSKIRDQSGRLAALLASERSTREIVIELFLATLSRPPTLAEWKICDEILPEPSDQRRERLEDILWMLLNHREFLFQH